MCSRARGEDVSFSDSKIKIPNRNCDQGIWVTSRTGVWPGIWGKAVSWVPTTEEGGWLSELGEARRLCALRAPRVGWVESWRCKSSQHRKTVSLSPHVTKPLNSERWINFRTLTNFGIFVFLDSLCLFHISVLWVCYTQAFPYIHLNLYPS